MAGEELPQENGVQKKGKEYVHELQLWATDQNLIDSSLTLRPTDIQKEQSFGTNLHSLLTEAQDNYLNFCSITGAISNTLHSLVTDQQEYFTTFQTQVD